MPLTRKSEPDEAGQTGTETPVIGEVKPPFRDTAGCDQPQETLALLRALALTGEAVGEGKVEPVADAFTRMRRRLSS